MSLSDQELKEIAYLARINVKDESLSSLKVELEEILKLFEELNEADTSDVDAMSHPLDLSQPVRKDEVTEKNEREELLKNAPSSKSGLFLVPKVIEGEG
jgi:aspartyl-tRNA(Asn)/glutamyl-tRNA(Gln) amidotransferase subunit C|tara:strand:+ start:6183 stop:6479 length:297 start_codon:yes stop_codon:yes gene_type:complete